jgi:hypothetical protein
MPASLSLRVIPAIKLVKLPVPGKNCANANCRQGSGSPAPATVSHAECPVRNGAQNKRNAGFHRADVNTICGSIDIRLE